MLVHRLSHPLLAALLHYWQTKCGGRALPARRDIDPLEMGPALLPHLLLADLLDRGSRLRFRLVGTNLVKRIGSDPTGRYCEDELSGPWSDLLTTLHRLVYCERAPVFAESEFRWGNGRRLTLQHLILPLTQDGPDPAIALGGVTFACEEPFPPTLRVLAATATHTELRRQVLKPLPAAEPVRVEGKIVA